MVFLRSRYIVCAATLMLFFSHALPADAGFEAELQEALNLLAMEEYLQARTILNNVLTEDPDNALAELLLGETLERLSNNYDATFHYLAGLESLRSGDFLEEVLQNTRLILTAEELDYLDQLPLDEKGAFLADYWRAKDPTPATITNEYLMEHLRRVQHARKEFKGLIPGSYDDRGYFYIKYGIPDIIVSTSGPAPVPALITWGFSSIESDLSVEFQSSPQGHYRVEDLGTILGGDTEAIRTFFEQRRFVTPNYLGVLMRGWMEAANDFLKRQADALRNASLTRYYYYDDRPGVEFTQNWSTFRHTEDSTRIEIYYGLPYRSLQFKSSPMGRMKSAVRLEANLFDAKGRPVARHRENLVIWAQPETTAKSRYYSGQSVLNALPGTYFLAVTISSMDEYRATSHYTEIVVPDYQPDALQISGIEWAFQVDSVLTDPVFQKGPLNVRPLPFTMIDRRLPLHAYFEIYNLAPGLEGEHQALVAYELSDDVDRKVSDVVAEGPYSGEILVKSREPFTRTWIPLNIRDFEHREAALLLKITDLSTGLSENGRTLLQIGIPPAPGQVADRNDRDTDDPEDRRGPRRRR